MQAPAGKQSKQDERENPSETQGDTNTSLEMGETRNELHGTTGNEVRNPVSPSTNIKLDKGGDNVDMEKSYETRAIRKAMHDAIDNKDFSEVKRCLNEASRFSLRQWLNPENEESALCRALQKRAYKIYAFLVTNSCILSEGKEKGKKSPLSSLNTTAADGYEHRYQLRSFVHRYHPVSYIMLKTTSKTKDFEAEVARHYETLYKVPIVDTIIRVVATSWYLQITFDFDSERVDSLMGPDHNRAYGLTFHGQEEIYIGGKRGSDNDLLGTIAHEFAHLALHLVYQNGGKPYKASDKKKQESYQKVIKKVKSKATLHEVIRRALFTAPERERSDDWKEKELIVRVPHILAAHSQPGDGEGISPGEKLLRQQVPELLQFFVGAVIPDMKQYIDKCNPRRDKDEIEKANLHLHTSAKLQKLGIEFDQMEVAKIMTSVLRGLGSKPLHIVSASDLTFYEIMIEELVKIRKESYLFLRTSQWSTDVEDIVEEYHCSYIVLSNSGSCHEKLTQGEIDDMVDLLSELSEVKDTRSIVLTEDSETDKLVQKLREQESFMSEKNVQVSHLSGSGFNLVTKKCKEDKLLSSNTFSSLGLQAKQKVARTLSADPDKGLEDADDGLCQTARHEANVQIGQKLPGKTLENTEVFACDKHTTLATDSTKEDELQSSGIASQDCKAEMKVCEEQRRSDSDTFVEALDQCTFLRLCQGRKVEAWPELPQLDADVDSCFIPRTCKRATQVKWHEDLFDSDEDAFALLGCRQEDLDCLIPPGCTMTHFDCVQTFEKCLSLDSQENYEALTQMKCYSGKRVHLLQCSKRPKGFHWLKSNGPLSHLPTVDSCAREFSDTMALLEEHHDKVLVICADPGMGKSVMSLRMARDIKAMSKMAYVIHIDVSKRITSKGLSAWNGLRAVTILAKLCGMTEGTFQFNLLEKSVSIGRPFEVFVIFDGYDEVVPEIRDFILALVVDLKKTLVSKVILFSRNSCRSEIQDTFHTMAFELVGFSDEQRLQFIEKLPVCTAREKILGFFHPDVESSVARNPLFIKMLAEVMEHSEASEVEQKEKLVPGTKPTLLYIYEAFVKLKFGKYLTKRFGELNTDCLGVEKLITDTRQSMYENHGLLALKVILTDKLLKELLTEAEQKKLLQETPPDNLKEGFVDGQNHGVAVFVHRTFAEFFAAHFIAHKVTTKALNDSQLKLIGRGLYESTYYEGLLSFLDAVGVKSHKLHARIMDGEWENIHELTSDVRDEFGRTPMHIAMLYADFEMVRKFRHIAKQMEVQDTFGMTPIMYKEARCERALRKFGANYGVGLIRFAAEVIPCVI